MTNENDITARVEVINGQIVLIDPVAVAVIEAITGVPCSEIFAQNVDRIEYFRGRAVIREKTAADVVIILANVDDSHGGAIADVLMPGYNWDEYRAQQQLPIARGLAPRDFIQAALDHINPKEGNVLRSYTGDVVQVVAISVGTAKVMV